MLGMDYIVQTIAPMKTTKWCRVAFFKTQSFTVKKMHRKRTELNKQKLPKLASVRQQDN